MTSGLGSDTQDVGPGVGDIGDLDIHGPDARQTFDLTGAGLRIGIISDSFDTATAAVRATNPAAPFSGDVQAEEADGDLPKVTVLSDNPGTLFSAFDEGRAMAELVHKIAPGAQIYFATDGGNETNTASAVASLEAAGCNVIVDDVSWLTSPFFQDGDGLQTAVETATASGVSYFTSAGNQGDHYYQATYANLTTQTVTINSGGTIEIDLQWTQPFASIGGGTGSVYSLGWELLFHGTGTVAYSSLNNQVNRDPVQVSTFAIAAGAYDVVIVNNAGSAVPTDTVKIAFMAASYGMVSMAPGTGSGTVYGQELVSSANVVGAVNANTTSDVESYSADGPGTIYYGSNGAKLPTPLTVGAPNYLAPDFITTSVSTLGTFAGTSAAVANAAAAGALLLQINPNLTSGQIQAALSSTASTVGLSGDAAQEGGGLINVNAAAALLYDGFTVVNGSTVYNGTSASHDRVQAWNHGGGSWTRAANWNVLAAPDATSYVTLGDNRGVLGASYAVTLAAAGGTVATLTVGDAASISAALNITGGGSLSVAGGATIGRSGAIVLAGSATLDVGGVLKLDDTTGATAVLDMLSGARLTAGSFDIIGGSATVAAGGEVTTTGTAFVGEGGNGALFVDGTMTVAGNVTVGQTGQITVGGELSVGGTLKNNAASSVTIGAGGTVSAVGMTGGHLTLDKGGLLTLSTSASSLLTASSGLQSVTIDDGGIKTTDRSAHILLSGITYNASTESLLFFPGTGVSQLVLALNNVTAIARLSFDNAGGFKQSSFSLGNDGGHAEINIACYAAGTHIATPSGSIPVETLHIGMCALTATGASLPIRWIGRRFYSASVIRANPQLRPVRIAAGALGPGLPQRDLLVSPLHGILVRGQLVPAGALVNTTTIRREPPNAVAYFHIELATHELLLAEGTLAESFIDEGSRAMFDNAVEFGTLYPAARPAARRLPRLEYGPAFEDMQARFAPPRESRGTLRGHVERIGDGWVEGWVMDSADPAARVALEITADGMPPLRLRAGQYRIDLDHAGLADGCCGFTAVLPRGLGNVRVRRAGDGLELPVAESLAA